MITSLPRLIVTAGEPAGIGLDICIALARQAQSADIVFLADPDVLQQRAGQLDQSIEIDIVEADCPAQVHRPGTLRVLPVKCPVAVLAGKLDTGNAPFVIEMLDKAVDLLLDNSFDALVTAPVHKGIINQAGIAFTGHTEWLAEKTNAKQPVMMLASKSLRVALVTTHLPLSEVSRTITRDHLQAIVRVLHHEMQAKFHIRQPRIRVCGINPHAGEDGHLGREEIDIIIPLIESLNKQGFRLEGPVSADTAFLPESLDETDVILAMYHDQGLPVLKYSGFEHAVNITLGLPIIRTSVGHGTALELAGTGKANPDSLIAAINSAISMVHLS